MEQDAFTRYAVQGYYIARNVFSPEEIRDMTDHFMAINAQGPHPGDFAGVPAGKGADRPDPLAKYPRLIQMHHWDERSRTWMNDPRLTELLALFVHCFGNAVGENEKQVAGYELDAAHAVGDLVVCK